MEYAICQIGNRQYLIRSGQEVEVDKLKNIKSFTCQQVLLVVEDGKVEIGKPFLPKQIEFNILGEVKKPKIRVATYKAKSNIRKVKGFRAKVTRLKMVEKRSVKKS